MSVITCFMTECYANDAEQTIILSVQPYISVTNESTKVNTTLNPITGMLEEPLMIVYKIVTDGTDDDYDLTVTSSIMTTSGPESAYDNNGNLLFANLTLPPTKDAVDNAKIAGGNNANVFSFPTSSSITSPMTSVFNANYGQYGNCYVIKLNNETDGTFTHTVSQNPVSGTYNVGQDQAGSYQTMIMLSVTPKL